MIAGWKIKRELSRMGQQLRAIPEAFFEPRAQKRYDAAFPTQLNIIEGRVGYSGKVALLLIFPRPDLAQSTLQLCQGLEAAGYAPLVVSNAPLTAEMCSALREHSWRLIERPNYGYDFGGYRDGIRLLWHWNITPDRLLVLNDSVWLVQNDPKLLLAQLEQARARHTPAIAGSILRQGGEVRFLESYCYLIGPDVFTAAPFKDYWQNLALTSNKYKVIRRGERGHSMTLWRNGISPESAFSNDAFIADLQAMSPEDLGLVLRYAAWLSDDDAAASAALLARCDEENWRDSAMQFLLNLRDTEQFYSLFPVLSARAGYPFLKRSADRVAKLWRRSYLAALDAGAIPAPDPLVLKELRARNAADFKG